MFNLSFQNQSSVVQDADVQAFIQDFQAQVSNEFLQAWGVDAFIDSGGNGWQIIITDNPGPNDPQGALGYHALDQNFNPYGIIFAQLALNNGISWTSVASHEGLEILADPFIDSVCFIDTSGGNGTAGFLLAQEVCDPVEQASYAGVVNGTQVSDFVFPGWFIAGFPGQVDQLGQLSGSLQLLPGGSYIGFDQVIQASGWQAIQADKVRTMAEYMKRQPKAVHYLPGMQG